MDQEFDKALGLGEDFKLRSEETIKVFPSPLADLKDIMPLFDTYRKYSIPGLYMAGGEEALKAFEDLLLLANGQGALRNNEEKRGPAVAELLKKFGSMDDGGDEVRTYILRFLGLVPRNTGATAE